MKNILSTIIFCALINSGNTQWHQMWSDEFNAVANTGINTNYWNYETGCICPNGETVCYTNDPKNVRHDGNGNLQIIAINEPGFCGQNYTSGRITTQGKFSQLYGKYEARIKLPDAQGTWPAFWLLGENISTVGWPQCGEIDIMETIWSDIDNNHSSAHGPGYSGATPITSSYNLPGAPTFADGYHLFTVEWSPNLVQFYVDGNWFYNFTPADLGGSQWVFDTAMFVILNVAVGGSWPGIANPSAFPDTMWTDYIRFYKWYDQVIINGPNNVLPNSMGLVYSVPNDLNYSYSWSVPPGATITSGAGTNSITVNWGAVSGTISLTLTDGTYSHSPDLNVNVSNNVLENHSFELDFSSWGYNNNGGSATFSIDQSSPQHQTKNAEINISSLGLNPYDIQLSQPNIALVNGNEYNLKFWAKGSTNGMNVRGNLIHNGPPWTNYHNKLFTLTNNWAEYTFNFTSNVTNPSALLTLDLGYNTGILSLDNFYFGFPENVLEVDMSKKLITDKDDISVIYSNGILSFSSEDFLEGYMSLYDLHGKPLYASFINKRKLYEIDMGQIADGIYITRIENENQIFIKKILITN